MARTESSATTEIAPVEVEPLIPVAAPITSPGGKPKNKTTPSLKAIFDVPAAVDAQVAVPNAGKEPVGAKDLRRAWDQFAEQRMDQAAEYQIMKREYEFQFPTITLLLTNPVEESLLDNFRRELTQYLRDTLKNGEISIATAMQEKSGKKVIYTSKEKFEHLAEKNPYLNELKDRLGLDWEF